MGLAFLAFAMLWFAFQRLQEAKIARLDLLEIIKENEQNEKQLTASNKLAQDRSRLLGIIREMSADMFSTNSYEELGTVANSYLSHMVLFESALYAVNENKSQLQQIRHAVA